MIILRQKNFSEAGRQNKKDKKTLAVIGATGAVATGTGIAISNKNISKRAKQELRDDINVSNFFERGKIKKSKAFIPKKEDILKRLNSTTNPMKEEKGSVAGVDYKINKKNAETFDYSGFEKKVEKSIKDRYSRYKNISKREIRNGAKAKAGKNAMIIAGTGLLTTGATAGAAHLYNKKKNGSSKK